VASDADRILRHWHSLEFRPAAKGWKGGGRLV